MRRCETLTNLDEVMSRLDEPQNLSNDSLADIDLSNLDRIIEERIFGQEHVMMPLFTRIRVNLEIPKRKRPLASVAVFGPFGVGKTELASCMAEALFGDSKYLLRIDANQMPDHAIGTWYGSPNGYVGCEKGGVIPNFVKERGKGVIHFDEVERVNGDPKTLVQSIMTLLDGRVTDVSTQQEYSLSNMVIYLSSNYKYEKLVVVTEKYQALQGKMTPAELEAAMRKEVTDILEGPIFPRPVLDRFDFIGVFAPLTNRVMGKIVVKETDLLATQHGIEVEEIDPDVVVEAIKVGRTGESTGARDFNRWVAQHVNPALVAAKRQGAQKVKLLLGPDRTVYATITAYREVRQTSSTGA